MLIFDKTNANELIELLYNSYAHDSQLENIEYNWGEDSIKFELFNTFFNSKLDLTFRNIRVMFTRKGNEYGSRTIVLSLSVEDDYSSLQTCLPEHNEYSKDSLYLLFQMFSGDELHIISKDVIVQLTK
ncbi:MAG: hypothetical protein E7462_04715 [Ruminococcaceae bacterium]|nr:hypothetical protein [Oscillospiraceae bacterium]